MSENMVTAVVDLLAQSNPAAANRFARNFKCNATDAQAQLCELNRYWRDQLSALHVSTISARTCLVDDIASTDWLRHFRSLVLPLIVKYDLPVAD